MGIAVALVWLKNRKVVVRSLAGRVFTEAVRVGLPPSIQKGYSTANYYWHTSFASSQRGYPRFRYRLFSGGADLESATRTALLLEAFGRR